MKYVAISTSAVTLALALATSGNAQPLPAPIPTFKAEKCYGIHVAGKNDCAAIGMHSCAGESKIARDPSSWIYVPSGTCEKIVGGSLTPKKA